MNVAQLIFGRMREIEKGKIRNTTEGGLEWMLEDYKREFLFKDKNVNVLNTWHELIKLVKDEFEADSNTIAFPRGKAH